MELCGRHGRSHEDTRAAGRNIRGKYRSGIAQSIADWAKACFTVVHRDWREYVIQKKLFTPEYSRLVANPARIQALGWRPKISLPQLAHMMVQDKADEI